MIWSNEDYVKWLIDSDNSIGYEEDYIDAIDTIIELLDKNPQELKNILLDIEDAVREKNERANFWR